MAEYIYGDSVITVDEFRRPVSVLYSPLLVDTPSVLYVDPGTADVWWGSCGTCSTYFGGHLRGCPEAVPRD